MSSLRVRHASGHWAFMCKERMERAAADVKCRTPAPTTLSAAMTGTLMMTDQPLFRLRSKGFPRAVGATTRMGIWWTELKPWTRTI